MTTSKSNCCLSKRSSWSLAVCVPLSLAVLGACGVSPVEMTEYPVTTTPSRLVGQPLARAADPDTACPDVAFDADPARGSSRTVTGADANGVTSRTKIKVPADPKRVVVLGASAADTICALGLNGIVVGHGFLPDGTELYLPSSIVGKPAVGDGEGIDIDMLRGLDPDLIVASVPLPDSAYSDLSAVSTTVRLPVSAPWPERVQLAATVLGRASVARSLLLDYVAQVAAARQELNPRDTQASLLEIRGDELTAMPRDRFGVEVFEAMGGVRTPNQEKTTDPPRAWSGDPLNGDVALVSLPVSDDARATAETIFGSRRWTELPVVEDRRAFMVDEPVWNGAGLVAARAVMGDLGRTLNSVAPDG